MADFKVSAEIVSKQPHPIEEGVFLISAGDHMLGIDRGTYEDGELVVLAPKRSIIPEVLAPDFINPETGLSILKEGNVVSQRGVGINKAWVVKTLFPDMDIPDPDFVLLSILGNDLAPRLGITEYNGSIPVELLGDAEKLRNTQAIRHDVYSAGVVFKNFVQGERVLVTEKVHGSQLNVIGHADGYVELGLKSLLKKGLIIKTDSDLIYAKAYRNSGLQKIQADLFPGKPVQFVSEVIPAQKGFSYGYSEDAPSLRIFRLIVDGNIVPLSEIVSDPHYAPLVDLWVPHVWIPYDFAAITDLSHGTEGISGEGLHIKEGVVVEPDVPRHDRRGRLVIAKFLNPAYTEKDSDPS